MIPIEKIHEISEYIKKYRAISNFEIAYLAVDGDIENGLNDDRVRFFMQIFMKNPHPILPHLPCKTDFREERFRYYPMKPSVFSLISSYKRVTEIKKQASIKILTKFLSDAGYTAIGIVDKGEVLGIKGNKELEIKVYGSIEEIKMDVDCDIKKYDILTLPSGNNLQPFMDFYSKYAKGIVNLGGGVWNIDLWAGEVSPFIGIPDPKMMYEFGKHFGKPRLASAINRLWQKDEYQEPLKFKSYDVSIKVGKIEFE